MCHVPICTFGTSSCRGGGIGRRRRLKISGWKLRTGSIPVLGTTCIGSPAVGRQSAKLLLASSTLARCSTTNEERREDICGLPHTEN